MDTAVDVMRQLKQYGRVRRPYLGIKMLQLNSHNAAQFRQRDPNFPAVSSGILVPGIHPGSPAERAGLRAGDCIVGRWLRLVHVVHALTLPEWTAGYLTGCSMGTGVGATV
jgi:S1-C subfamily serine protease